MMKYGLVLEGGAMRGIFSAGVMDVLMENGIDFNCVTGVSAGACFGCNWKSRQNGRVIRYNLRFCRNKDYCSWSSLIRTGDMFGADFCYRAIPDEYDPFDYDTYRSDPSKFIVVATDIETGKPVYHVCRNLDKAEIQWIRASASMPLAARIVEIGGRKFLDGGIADSIPLSFMEHSGYDKNVVVLTQPRGFVKKPSSSAKLVNVLYRKYPKLVEAYNRRPAMYNSELEHVRRSEEQGKAFVIAPPEKLPIGHVEHDQDTILEVYRIGRKAASDRLDELRQFMGEQPF